MGSVLWEVCCACTVCGTMRAGCWYCCEASVSVSSLSIELLVRYSIDIDINVQYRYYFDFHLINLMIAIYLDCKMKDEGWRWRCKKELNRQAREFWFRSFRVSLVFRLRTLTWVFGLVVTRRRHDGRCEFKEYPPVWPNRSGATRPAPFSTVTIIHTVNTYSIFLLLGKMECTVVTSARGLCTGSIVVIVRMCWDSCSLVMVSYSTVADRERWAPCITLPAKKQFTLLLFTNLPICWVDTHPRRILVVKAPFDSFAGCIHFTRIASGA